MLRFSAPIDIRIGNPFILVDAEKAQSLKKDWRKPMPVKIRINGEPKKWWQVNMMPVGNGDFYLYLHGDVREASDTKVGDTVDVEIKFDTQYKNGPMHAMPTWFMSALSKNAKAKNGWDALIPSRQKEILRYFSWLKSDAAIERNLEKALRVLSGKKERFMARDWNA